MKEIKTQADVESALKKITDLHAKRLMIEKATLVHSQTILLEGQKKIDPINKQIDQLFQACQVWSLDNKNIICNGKTKTLKLATGNIEFKDSKPSIKLDDGVDPETIIKTLKRRKLESYIRVTEAIDKNALVAAPDVVKKLPGVSIVTSETLYIKPAATKLRHTYELN